MASRKKGKKTKGQTVNLTEFLSSGPPVVPLKSTSWADDPDDEYDNGSYMPKSSKEPVVLPTAPRAARGPGFEDENIPHNPPYVAYISNLPYDVVDEDLEELFQDMMISNIRLPKDSTKARGYGYVEFEDREGLIAALSMANTMVKTRRVRIDVSNSSNEERRGGGRMGMNRDNNRRDGYDDPERTSGDWRSKPREEPTGGNDDRYRSRGNFDRRDDRETSESDNKPGGWREGDRSTLSFNDKRSYRGGGDDDRRGGGGGGRFTNDERRGGGGFRNDNDWSRDRNTSSFGPRRDGPRDEPRDEPSAEPRERQKLVLAKRTKPVEPIIVIKPEEAEIVEEPVKEIKPAPKKPAADIFGAAKPVDTTAREREIEERLAKSNAEKAAKEETTENKTWGRRNGEGGGRVDREKEKPRPTWRSDEDRNERRQDNRHTDRHDRRQDNRGPSGRSDNRGDLRNDSRINTRHGAGQSRGGGSGAGGRNNDSRGPPEKERRERERDSHKEDPPMPKATDKPTVNFVASNKFSMLPEDVDPDIDA